MPSYSDVAKPSTSYSAVTAQTAEDYGFLLQENGDYLLQENGDKIILSQTKKLTDIGGIATNYTDINKPS